MKRLALLTVLALGALLALAGPASAHVTVSSTNATQGGYAVVTFNVPSESDTASTTKVVVALPPLGSVSVEPTPGWSVVTKESKLTTPIKTDDGEMTQAVSQITWTTTDGGLKPGEFQQFDVSMGPLPKTKSISFRAIQYYSDGTIVKWIETPAPGSTAEPDHPAPTLQLAATSAGDSSSDSAMAGMDMSSMKVGDSSDTGAIVLSIVALVVAVGALGFAVVTRARSRA